MPRLPLPSLFIPILSLPPLGDETRPANAFECRWTEERIVIGGRADEGAWQAAMVIDGFGQPWLAEPGKPAGTKVKLLWDREWLYFLAELEERDVWADK